MQYIDQLDKGNKKNRLLLYLPFSFFYLGLMALNWLIIRYSSISVKEMMNVQVEKLGENLAFFQIIIPFTIFLIMLFVWVLFVHKQKLHSLTTSRNRVDVNRFFVGFGVQALFVVLGFLVSYLLAPEDFQLNFQLLPFLVFFVIAIIFIPIQTSFEEYFFRGYLMQGIGLATRSRAVALLSTSILFGLMHMANPEVEVIGSSIMIYYIGTGLFLGIITLLDKGLELALGFHAANNLIGALLVTSNWTAFQTNSIFLNIGNPDTVNIAEFIWPVIIIYPLLLLFFSKKYHWTDWKKHLFGKVK